MQNKMMNRFWMIRAVVLGVALVVMGIMWLVRR
jgi:hypothetical protein